MENLILRNAEQKDLIEILDIFNYSVLNTTSVYLYKLRTYEEQLSWFKQKSQEGFPVIVAEYNNQIAGFASYGHFRPFEAYNNTIENSVYVKKDFYRNGIGKILLAKIILLAKENKKHAIIAVIDSENQASINLHEQFEFKIVGNFKQIGFKFDRWLDVIFMELIL